MITGTGILPATIKRTMDGLADEGSLSPNAGCASLVAFAHSDIVSAGALSSGGFAAYAPLGLKAVLAIPRPLDKIRLSA